MLAQRIQQRYFLCVLCCALLFFADTVFANSSAFRVGMSVGGDTVPPSTPSALSALPVAQTQIDLAWGASTDDFLFGGYQVFRDGLQIATTTLTNYVDSGLVQNTSYSYFVRAFDAAFNISSSSNSVATSTLPATPVATTTATSTVHTGGGNSVHLLSFNLQTQQRGAMLSWQTSQYAQFELRWGRTTSYEIGFVANELFKKEHSTSITELSPGTTYEYQLVAYDRNGHKVILKTGQFTTQNAPDTTAPTNVFDLHAEVRGNNVVLTWQNPADSDFSKVRIVRNYLFYPSDTYDGFTAYQNSGTAFQDIDALAAHDTLYYTVFSYDTKGNISSGAVIAVSKHSIAPRIHASTSMEDTTHTATLQFTDIEFVQHDTIVSTSSIDTDVPLLVRVPYGKLPEHLKTITVSFTHPFDSGASFSFLLRINKEKTYYEATLAPLKVVGVYPTALFVFDYQTHQLINLYGSITTHKASLQGGVKEIGASADTFLPALVTLSLYSLLFLLLLFLLYLFVRNLVRRER